MRPRIAVKSVVAVILFACSTALYARPIERLRDDIRGKLRQSASTGEKVVIRGIPLGGELLRDIEVELMRVWASDARIAVHTGDTVEYVAPPDIRSFKGRVIGSDDGIVYLSLAANGKVDGIVLLGERRFNIATAQRVGPRSPILKEADAAIAPVALYEIDAIDDLKDGQADGWTCYVEDLPNHGVLNIPVPEATKAKLKQRSNAGNVSGASYSLRLTIETDFQLFNLGGFGTAGAVTAYLTDLVGKASVIYQRDLNTTLTIGHSNVYTTDTDPWTSVSTNTGVLVGDLGTYYATAPGLTDPNYGGTQRSTVVWVSGRTTNGGIAWLDTLCTPDFFCGIGGASCGSATYANKYAGGYAFCGSLTGMGGVTNTVPDPDLTVNSVQYGVPTANNYWMLLQFAHELGHNVSSQHTHCVGLTAPEKITFGVTRDFVDECLNSEGGCFSGTQAAPPELGSIMSYCHNIFSGGFRQSRYTFGKAGETSSKMLTILRIGDAGIGTTGLEGATPNPTITTGGAPIPCAAGQAASVPSCGGCTYAWQITGGTITSSTTTSSITYTPNAVSTTLTATVTSQRGCGITAPKTVVTSCAGLAAPTNVVATATTSTNVLVTWTAAIGATTYNVYRTPNNATSFTLLMGGVVPTTFNDTTATSGSAYLYKVRSFNGVESGNSNVDLATTVIFTDPTITNGVTLVKEVHSTQLRTAIDAVRALNALGNFSYTTPSLTGMVINSTHMIDLRTALNQGRAALGFSALSYTDPTITGGVTTVKGAHIVELRLGVQ